ncbi:unnamed protein product [Trichobilharzia regenti]|nr:unnamed protein product [Trichobilharzia regenti]
MAPRAIQLLYKACTKYDAWKQSNNPDQKPWLYSHQNSLPNLCWDDVEQTANLGPVDDDASASGGGDDTSGQLTPLDDERSGGGVFDRSDSFNDSEDFQPIMTVVDNQMQSCVPQAQTTAATTALTTVSDSG